MSTKGSYFAKHKSKLGLESPEAFTRQYKATEAQQAEFAEGRVLLIDKPLHWTSFDVVRKIRNTIKIKKVGHAGTLDPLATGLLIVCTGKFTKKINEFMGAEKEYTGTITLGATTPTYDLESNPENFKDFANITEANILEAVKNLTGIIQQFPPIYSALKVNGESMYTLARRGEDIELKARTITVSTFEVDITNLPIISFSITCGTGTYIRSIANDLGHLLGCGAHLSSLRRERIGDQNVKDAFSMQTFLENFEEFKKDS